MNYKVGDRFASIKNNNYLVEIYGVNNKYILFKRLSYYSTFSTKINVFAKYFLPVGFKYKKLKEAL